MSNSGKTLLNLNKSSRSEPRVPGSWESINLPNQKRLTRYKLQQMIKEGSNLMPPGTMTDTSPGTVISLTAIWKDSNTFSTLEPSIPCGKESLQWEKDILSFFTNDTRQSEWATYLLHFMRTWPLSYTMFHGLLYVCVRSGFVSKCLVRTMAQARFHFSWTP